MHERLGMIACAAAVSMASAAPAVPEPRSAGRHRGRYFSRSNHEATESKSKSDSLARLLGKRPRRG